MGNDTTKSYHDDEHNINIYVDERFLNRKPFLVVIIYRDVATQLKRTVRVSSFEWQQIKDTNYVIEGHKRVFLKQVAAKKAEQDELNRLEAEDED
jgi:hypothetical protein